jgi:hypothetical protein
LAGTPWLAIVNLTVPDTSLVVHFRTLTATWRPFLVLFFVTVLQPASSI